MLTEVMSVEEDNPDLSILEKVANAIQANELVVYPTETVYGLGADATSDEAVAKVFEAKSRPLEKPISVAVDSLSMSYQVGKVARRGEKLIQEFMPGPLTLIVEARPYVSKLLLGGTGNVGIRIPEHSGPLNLIEILGGPITTTSANLTDEPEPREVKEALDQLGQHVEYALDAGRCSIGKPSTVLDLTGDELEILREGPISESEIRSVL